MDKLLAAIFLIFAAIASAGAEPLPFSWRQSMTEDPDTNPVLKKFSAQNPDALVQFYRIKGVTDVMEIGCKPNVNPAILAEWLRQNTFRRYSNDEKIKAKMAAKSEFHGFDKQSVAQTCAGWRALFGAKGTMLPGFVNSIGALRRDLYIVGDPNPYLRLPSLD